jgi:type IV pilus assembly protein PilY1
MLSLTGRNPLKDDEMTNDRPSTTVRSRRRTICVAAALLFASAAQAGVTIDQSPLIVAQPLPPNILFIMDDSGSMAWQHMPGTTSTWSNSPPSGLPYRDVLAHDIRLRAANVNAQWYDPSKTYHPWVNHENVSWGDIDPRSAPWDASGVVTIGTRDLGQTTWPSVTVTDTNSSTTGSTWRFQGFYVLNENADPGQNANYKRYDFRRNFSTWEARLHTLDASAASTGYTTVTSVTWPGGLTRTVAEEVQNYANWFSYYRLRINMAKAAASRVFGDLGEDYRVGYNTIWNRQNYRIPVGTDNGLFRSENKEQWFTHLFATIASNGTPLRESLDAAGQYFSDTGADGPYGPGSGNDQLTCRQNFTIMTTDGYWNSNAAATADARQDTDSTAGSEITGPNGATYTYSPTAPYADNRSNTLADVAMYYWKNDLRSDLKNDVPTSASNPAFWQHMVTFGISIGERGVLDPSTDLPALTDGTLSWPAPGNDRTANIDDLWHATINSRGEFIVASDADAFAQGLKDALGVIGDRLGSGASLAANSTKLETGTTTFQAQYWSGAWRGELNAFAVDPDTGNLASTPTWRATAQMPAWGSRTIKFYDPSVNFNNAFKTFQYANLNATQQAALNNSAALVDYLRGQRSGEESQGGTFRDRVSILGDIVNSQPVFVGAPNPRLYTTADFTGASAFGTYATSLTGRTPVVYLGANDGMLHGFNANTGAELFAFIPNNVILNGLANLADPEYEHRYFVDGELTVADVYDSGSANSWKTILVGTLGRGGRTVFALDVTDPANIKLLWEKNASDIPALGNTLGRPVIAQVANGDWRVILGNGPNGSGDSAQLIMLDVLNRSATPVVIDTGVSGDNGLSSVRAWDSNGDGFTDTVYAGDLRGNLWRFSDIASSPTLGKLFVAEDRYGMPQPITATPLTGKNPNTGETWVFFGTGQYLNQEDLTNPQIQTWYGLMETGTTLSRINLLEREILAEGQINGFGARVIDEAGIDDMIGKEGWFMDLESPVNGAEGERMVVPNQFQGRVLIGTTRIPDPSDPCNPSGRGFVMAIDPFTGARLDRTFFDITLDGLFNDDDKLLVDGVLVIVSGIGFSASPNNPIFIENVMQVSLEDGSTRAIATQGTSADALRGSWREIIGN